MKFEKFTGRYRKYQAYPHKMEVGQIIERESHTPQSICMLKKSMSEAMLEGMEFSVSYVGNIFAIRRDK